MVGIEGGFGMGIGEWMERRGDRGNGVRRED